MPWQLIRELLGPGLHWSKTQKDFQIAIAKARALGREDAAQHLEIMWERRNAVVFESKASQPPRP